MIPDTATSRPETRPHVLMTGAYPPAAEAALGAAYTLHRLHQAEDRDAFLAQVGPDVQAIATRGDLGADAALMAACPQARLIAVFGVGYDAVDLTAAAARGIRVTNTPDVLTDDVADLAVGMMLALTRGIVASDAWVRSGAWAARGGQPLRRKVTGRRAGILGLGRIGAAIARRLEGFGMEIAYASRSAKPGVPRDWAFVPDAVALAARSDYLFVALAATAETRHAVNAEVLAALGPDGALINISRAANVDEGALLDALEAGRLAGAALDVFEGEPHLNPRFLTAPNLLLQPHHGSATVETRAAMGQLVCDNLAAHFAGHPLPTPVI